MVNLSCDLDSNFVLELLIYSPCALGQVGRLTITLGGNIQDLVIRTGCAALGTIWAGLAFAAGNGSPYVMAIFAAIFMLPMLYRFGQSNHPRSGLVGCLSFSVVSLIAYADDHHTSASKIAWTRGLPFVVGVAAALVINWFFWPFVARHELRKSISTMLLHSAILYRSVIEPPGPEEILNSEMLEGRLREVFVRIRQLLEMTRHEVVRPILSPKSSHHLPQCPASSRPIRPSSLFRPYIQL